MRRPNQSHRRDQHRQSAAADRKSALSWREARQFRQRYPFICALLAEMQRAAG